MNSNCSRNKYKIRKLSNSLQLTRMTYQNNFDATIYNKRPTFNVLDYDTNFNLKYNGMKTTQSFLSLNKIETEDSLFPLG